MGDILELTLRAVSSVGIMQMASCTAYYVHRLMNARGSSGSAIEKGPG